MNRRTVLAITGALGASGVVGGFAWSSSTNGGLRNPDVSVYVDSAPPEFDFSLTARVTSQFTRTSPTRLEISLTNEAAETREFLFGASPPFSRIFPEGPSRVVLIPEANDHISPISAGDDQDDDTSDRTRNLIPTHPSNGCWKLQTDIAVFGSGTRMTLDPGETIRESYAVLGGSGGVRCLPAGQYRFEAPNYRGEDRSWGGLAVTLEEE